MNSPKSFRFLISVFVCLLVSIGLHAEGSKTYHLTDSLPHSSSANGALTGSLPSKMKVSRRSNSTVTADLVINGTTYPNVLNFTDDGNGGLVFIGITYHPTPNAQDLEDIEESYSHQPIPAAGPYKGATGIYLTEYSYYKYSGGYTGYLDFTDDLLTSQYALSYDVFADILANKGLTASSSSIYCMVSSSDKTNYNAMGSYNGNSTSWTVNNTWGGQNYSQTRSVAVGDLYWKNATPNSVSWIYDAYYYQDTYPYTESFNASTSYTNSYGQYMRGNKWTMDDDGSYITFHKYIPPQYMTKITPEEFSAAYRASADAQRHRNAYRAWEAGKIAEFQTALASCEEIVIPSVVSGKTVTDVNWSYSPFTINATKLKLPTSITTITRVPSADYLPELTTVNIKDLTNLSRICSYAFSDCNSLVVDTLVLPNDRQFYIGRNAFSGVTINWLHEKNFYYYYADAEYISSEDKYYLHMLSGLKNSKIYLDNNFVIGVNFFLDYNEEGGEKVFYTDATNKIFVPYNLWSSYQSTDGWKDIKDQIYPYSPTPLSNRYVIIDGEKIYTGYGLQYTDDSSTMTTRLSNMGPYRSGINVLEIPGEFEDGYATVAVTGCQSGSWKQVILPATCTELFGSAFSGCSNLETINLQNITTITDERTFYNCTNLNNVTLHSSLTALPDATFNNCSSLTQIDLSHVITISDFAFNGCTALQNVTFSDDLNTIGNGAFSKCPITLLDLRNASNLSKIGAGAFSETHIASLFLPGSLVTNSGDIRFLNNGSDNTNGVDFANSSFAIGNGAFSKNAFLKNVHINWGVNGIADDAFSYCPELTYIYLPGTLLYIGKNFLCGAKKLTELQIPASVTDINGAFLRGCESLRKVTLLGEPAMLKKTSIGGDSFSPVDLSDDWAANLDGGSLHCKHVNDCQFTVISQDKYHEFINYQNLDGEYPWLRLDRFDLDYNLIGSDNNGSLSRDGTNWNEKQYYSSHTSDFLINVGINGQDNTGAYESFRTAVLGSSAPAMRRAANQGPVALTPAQTTTYWEQFEKTGYHNRYINYPPTAEEAFEAKDGGNGLKPRWRTICFPFKPNAAVLDELLGSETIIAKYVHATRLNPNAGPNEECLYGLTFQAIDHRDIQVDRPYLIRPSKVETVNIPMYSEEAIPLYNNVPTPMTVGRLSATIDTVQTADNEPGTDIWMIGRYDDCKLQTAEFYLKNVWCQPDTAWAMSFYKVSEGSSVSLKKFKCFFRIEKDGVPIKKVRIGSTINLIDEESGTTTIDKIELFDDDEPDNGPVYNLQGQKVANRLEGAHLPDGVYIVNGKKIVISKK